MSGHSKWATIKRKKAATDAARGKIFTRIAKEITLSARDGGGDPSGNPRLRLAIQNAKDANMPSQNVERAIKKGTGELEGQKYEEVTYEAYAPNGIAMIIECVTDNRNRTVADLRHLISKKGGNLGESGSVSWMFERKGVVTADKDKSEEEMIELILEAGAEDLRDEEDVFEIITPPDKLDAVRRFIDEKKIKVKGASLQFIPKDLITVEGKNAEDVMKCVEAVEEYEDVQNLYTNADFILE